jgi:dipeptidyl aminopeptidase/acylaminoacyl peptidase
MLFALALALTSPVVLSSSPQGGGYRLPPAEVVEIVDAPPTPSVVISPDMRSMLLVERPSLPSIAEVARPWIGLAGRRIDPGNNGPQTLSLNTGLLLRDLGGANESRIALPEDARISSPSWSHTGERFAFTVVDDERIDLWVGDVTTRSAKLVARGLNAIIGGGFDWMPDGERLLVHLVPEKRGPAPVRPRTPTGPAMMETSGEKSPVRTYQDLLATPHDEALFEYYMTSQTAIVHSGDGEAALLGKPGLYLSLNPSPDAVHFLVTRIERPFSYLMPYWSFPQSVELWSAAGERESVVADIPMAENVPIGGVRTGPRSFSWWVGRPATLVWAEALDGGDPKREASHRDRWMAAEAGGDLSVRSGKEILRTEHRARGLSWMSDPERVIASEYDRDRRWTRSLLHNLSDEASTPVVLDDRSVRDRYGDPGSPVTEPTAQGQRVVRQDGDWIFRTGSGASPEGLRPFLDRQNLKTLESERLWRCEDGSYERVSRLSPTSAAAMSFVTVHESPVEPPNWRLHGLADDKVQTLTAFTDPTPELRGIEKELVTYERKDGVQLSATLYLPADHEQGTRLPLVVWAYPREFNDPKTAGQVGGTPYRFTRIGGSSHLFFLTQGYAIMDGATMPIIGDPETMNDVFIDQIVSSAEAAIEKAVAMGVADGGRVGVGGHSYGAFMTANLLAHCDLFNAGVARSGAYNRTLTPFGFQSERRTLWEAPEAYARISPFFHADKINEPMLMIHGRKDSNSGTYPIQSERMYHAIKGNGGKARLVMLPEESHGYRARESVLPTLAEMIDWFDLYVKNGPQAGLREASSK